MYNLMLNDIDKNQIFHRSPSRIMNLIVPSRDESNLKNIFQLEPQYIHQALAASNAFQGAIGPDLNFDFNKAWEIGQNLPRLNILLSGLNDTVVQETLQVSSMISKLKGILKEYLYFIDISNTTFWNEVEATITNTFTNLYTQTNSAWIFFYRSTSTSTSYYYNTLFAIQYASFMIVVPIVFEITVRLEKQKVLFITIKDRSEYRVTMKLIIAFLSLQGNRNKSIEDVFYPKTKILYR
ncbi:hypothetical protein IIU_06191 [Bacillus cereus VD133]|uniref:Uncharacterized protein n=1 Tax=Bacillus cereus VD133 TaxID=1053233 RepID=A0A9W5PJN3_BACCE|nr:hypothetical protein [Bacillus cereus]EOO23740.1 hypothetical protein IIU_06944 [Bacillus cereus VD133]EOO24293.1 hypothetical protein IIU_06764 [Bacillus cereus VD133]EOO25160.1 hypothetical protein IIU_06409 [Bacillus cereus VD133]EOO25450.1 hypothetical protein IIU_06191 [Bacillus cereus VD133]